MITLTNHHLWWGRSEVVIIYPKECRRTLTICANDLNNTGWWLFATPLKNMTSSIGMIIPNILKNNKCSKPPTRWSWDFLNHWLKYVFLRRLHKVVNPTIKDLTKLTIGDKPTNLHKTGDCVWHRQENTWPMASLRYILQKHFFSSPGWWVYVVINPVIATIPFTNITNH